MCISFVANGQQLGVYPTQLDYTLVPGQSETHAITISNGTSGKVQFRLYLNDWVRDSMGGHIYYPADTLERSCARWVNVSKNFVELEPGQTTQVNVKMQLPDSAAAASEMKWAMLFVETVEEQNKTTMQSGATVNNLLRIGVHIYQTPPTVTNKKIKAIALKEVPDTKNTYRLLCENQGDIMVDCKSYIELSSLADGKKTKLDATEFPMFPKQRRYVTFQLPANLAKGKYSALTVVDYGEDVSLEAIQTTIEVK
jgi:hypothetical protein